MIERILGFFDNETVGVDISDLQDNYFASIDGTKGSQAQSLAVESQQV